MIDLVWPDEATEDLYRDLHRIAHAVAAEGGAVGWLVAPDRDETDRWIDGVLADVGAGDGALCVAEVDGRAEATGSWRRDRAQVFRHRAEVTKIMAHPDARGLGLGRRVTGAIVDHARATGLETLHLGVRGNNHLAIALYEELGFRVWGRMPDAIAVGDLRFDDVRMVRSFPLADGVVAWGSQPGGPGGSPRPPTARPPTAG